MKVVIWGGTGSLPASLTTENVRQKIFRAIEAAQGYTFNSSAEIEYFINAKLPFAARGTYAGNTSCVEVRDGEQFVLFDAGSGIRNYGRYILRNHPEPSCYHIFISHLHWDHIQGFPFFLPAFIKGNTIKIYGCHRELETAFAAQQSQPFFPVDLDYMQAVKEFHILEPDREYEIAGYTVKSILQDHPGESYGYSLKKNGKNIIYSTDSEHRDRPHFEKTHIELFKNADLLIFDAQYSLMDSFNDKESWGHSSNMVGVEIAVRAGIKHLCLFHNDPAHDDETLDKTLHDAEKYASLYADAYKLKISLAYDGLEIEV